MNNEGWVVAVNIFNKSDDPKLHNFYWDGDMSTSLASGAKVFPTRGQAKEASHTVASRFDYGHVMVMTYDDMVAYEMAHKIRVAK